MAQRVCDECGKTKDIEGGRTCDKGHFICKSCVGTEGFLSSKKSKCPIDGTKLK